MEKTAVRYLEPGGIIWKVLPDEQGNHLVIESRDGERRKTCLSVLSLTEQRFLVKELPAPQAWWIGLKAVGAGKIIFQGYRESQTPEPMGVYVMDLLTGKLSWKDEGKIVYSFGEKESMILSAREEEQVVYYKAMLSTGKLAVMKEGEWTAEVPSETSSVFPLLYSEENIHYPTLVSFLEQNGYKTTGPVEYLEYKNKLLISFYVPEGKKLVNILLITDEDGNVLLEDHLTEGADGIGMSSFFICNEKLIYIKNKTSIALAEP